MSVKRALLEVGVTEPPEPPQIEIKYVIDGVSMAMDLALECLDIRRSVSTRTEMSKKEYADARAWVYENSAKIGMDIELSLAAEHEGNRVSLALEGLGSFLSKIWQMIVNGFKFIGNVLKRIFGVYEDTVKKDYDRTISNLQLRAQKIKDNEYHYDTQKLNESLIKDNRVQVFKNNVLVHLDNSGFVDIRSFVDQQQNKLKAVVNLLLALVGDASPTNNYIIKNKGHLVSPLTPVQDTQDFKELITSLQTNKNTCLSILPTADNTDDLKKAFLSIYNSRNSDEKIKISEGVFTILHTSGGSYIVGVTPYNQDIKTTEGDNPGINDLNKVMVLGLSSKYDGIKHKRKEPDVKIVSTQDLINYTSMVDKMHNEYAALISKLSVIDKRNNDITEVIANINTIMKDMRDINPNSQVTPIQEANIKVAFKILRRDLACSTLMTNISSEIIKYPLMFIDFGKACAEAYTAAYTANT